MTRLKLADLADEKPVRVTVELSSRLHRELVAYAVVTKGTPTVERIIPPMLERFVSSDREFAKERKVSQPTASAG
jgi:hypothetical protein